MAFGLLLQLSAPEGLAQGQTPSASAQPDAKVPAVEVVGRRQSGDYHAEEAAGTKSDLPLRELPQAVRVMSRQTLDDLGAVRLDDALDYVGGVSRQNHFGGLWDNVAIRGLAGDVNNGMALLKNGFSGNRGFNAPRDTANVERIEFLKGPIAALYGVTEPGGTINLVTKKPLWQSAHAVEGYAGSFGFKRLTLDSTGPIGEQLAYRFNLAHEDRESFRDFVTTERLLLAPAATWRASANTRIDYTGEFIRHETPLDRGVVAIGTTLGAVSRERFLGEPNDGAVTVENTSHQVTAEHVLTPNWRAQFALAYKSGELNGFSTEPQPSLQDERTLRRQRRFRDYTSDDTVAQAEAIGKFAALGAQHELLVGIEGYRFTLDQFMLRVNPSANAPYAIDVLNPQYGQTQPTPLPNTNTYEKQTSRSVYVQNSLSAGDWRVVGGLRVDRYEQTLENRRTGAVTRQSPSETSPRLGVSYLPSRALTLFANAGKSFRPNTGATAAGGSFAPERGQALEAGLKWENAAKNLGATLSFFEIRKKNVLTSDPLNPGFSVAAGEVKSRGFDADFSGQLDRHWRVNASLSYIDAKVTRDNTLAVGDRLLNIPKINGSVLLMYEAAAGNQRVGLGGGVTHTGKRLGEGRTQAQAASGAAVFDLPQYTTAKLVAYWRYSSNLRFSLDVDNVTDKVYYTNSFQRTWVMPGAARSVVIGVQGKF